ncbi:MAG TPA: FecR domain-containing protein [Pseudorhodoplanes sp.]|nr:FecR domain-containing protein [Pseudorhodoplanes sp.]
MISYAPGNSSGWLSRIFQRRKILSGGAAAALAASIVGVLVYSGTAGRYHTEMGEIRRVALEDGSTAAINTDSSIAVTYSDRLREVRIDKGEAWFQVKHDRTRPFLVEAGQVRVRAVGTAFSVRKRANGVEVVVTEGVVAAWKPENVADPVSASAGTRLFIPYAPKSTFEKSVDHSVERPLAWRNGEIEITALPLQDAASEFNRYNRRQIVVANGAVARERVDGIFRTDDPEGFANAVRNLLDVPVDLSNPDKIVIGEKFEKNVTVK